MIRTPSLALAIPSFGRLPRSEVFARRYFGRNLDLVNIETAILMAQIGIMSPITDLVRETLRNDPAVSGMVFKRISSLSACDWDLQPAQVGVDNNRAKQIADTCRTALLRFRDFRQFLFDMGWGPFDGRAACEINWEIINGPVRYWPTAHTWIHPGRLSFGPQRELRIVERHQQTSLYYQVGHALNDQPAGKIVQWMPRNFGEYPEREGLAPRVLYWCFFKRFSWRHRMSLTELFGIPWRIIETDASGDAPIPSPEALDDAEAAAENLGAETTLALEPGMKLRVESPHPESGTLFGMNSDEVNDELAKLILMQPKTTSGEANRAAGVIGERQEDVPKQRDGTGLQTIITEQLLRPFVELNYGVDDLIYCPTFHLRTDPPRDRKADIDRAGAVLAMGQPITRAEIYEVSGFRAPKDGEETIRTAATGGGQGHGHGGLQITPTDVATFVTVNEGRASEGLEPLTTANGQPDPDGLLTITAYKAKYASILGIATAATSGKPEAMPTGGTSAQLPAATGDDATAAVQSLLDAYDNDALVEPNDGTTDVGLSVPRSFVELAIAPGVLPDTFGARLSPEELARVPGLGDVDRRNLLERAELVLRGIRMVAGGHARPPFRRLRPADVPEREPGNHDR